MRIRRLLWPRERIDHIAKHGITPEEVEEVCFGRPLVFRAKSKGKNPVYYVLGRTHAGRHLFCVVIQFPDGNGFPVTARLMTSKENTAIANGRNDEDSQTSEDRFDRGSRQLLG
jgi:uncharacterized DUF497 family protein